MREGYFEVSILEKLTGALSHVDEASSTCVWIRSNFLLSETGFELDHQFPATSFRSLCPRN